MVYGLTRLNKQYEAEAHELERDARAAAEAPVFHRHTVLLLVANLDRAAAKGIQYARSLTPDELRAVHVAVDLHAADELMDEVAAARALALPARARRLPRPAHRALGPRGRVTKRSPTGAPR